MGNIDLTTGKPWHVILQFSLPLLGAFILQQLYNTADMLVLGHYVGQEALSAVGASGNYLGVFITIATGLASGVTVCVGNAYGARQIDKTRKYIFSSLLLQLFIGIAVSIIGILIAKPILSHIVLLPSSLMADATLYVNVYMAGFVFQMAYNTVAGILRGLGDSKSSLHFLALASVVNILLDVLFVGCFKWGVIGVALATTAAQLLCATISLRYLFRNYSRYTTFGLRGQWRGIFKVGGMAYRMGSLARTSLPLMLQAFMLYVGFMLLQRTVNSFGTDMTASYAVVTKLDRYIMAPLIVVFDAMAAFASQNMGARRWDRIKMGLGQMRWVALAIAGIFCVIGLIMMPIAVRWFEMNEVATSYAIQNLTWSSIDLFLYALYCPITGCCLGLKQTMVPLIVSFVELTGRNVFARLLAPAIGSSCIWLCEPPAWGVVIAGVWIYYYASVRPSIVQKL
ncbi:MAG: MATE family efflux transporter [Bacteroidales bacterium]|nr:MATE family efflux transporter [Candidatus Colimorpha onthohippi]